MRANILFPAPKQGRPQATVRRSFSAEFDADNIARLDVSRLREMCAYKDQIIEKKI